MAITTTGNISIKEAAGAANSIDTEMKAASSGSLVALSQASNEYTGSQRGSTPRDTDTSPYGMLEFSGYQHIQVDDDWPTVDTPSGSAGNAIPQGAPTGWGGEFHHTYPFQTAEAFCWLKFTRTDTGTGEGNVKVESVSGTAASWEPIYIGYLNWSGLEETTSVHVKYVAATTSDINNTLGPNTPAESNYQSGTWYNLNNTTPYRQFKWMAKRSGSNALAQVSTMSVVFHINIYDQENYGDSPVNYSFESNSDSINLFALYGEPF